MSMRLLYLTILAASAWATTLGCSGGHHHSTRGPAVIPPDWRREHDPVFSERDREMIRVARRQVELSEGHVVDGYYQVRRTPDGYHVSVLPVQSYKDGQPEFRMSSDRTVELREDGSLIRIVGGW